MRWDKLNAGASLLGAGLSPQPDGGIKIIGVEIPDPPRRHRISVPPPPPGRPGHQHTARSGHPGPDLPGEATHGTPTAGPVLRGARQLSDEASA
jgi:hypothetical protein